ncbi:DEAD/DEAH box helicase [Pedobacter hartonius]|uniref:Superfamily I DNA and/or RNA helicase n=1 Tax=Pedobacter hartonius TaxID=425514 RepID=A0A1H4F530_9SPHI|nr:ATP-binding protein [Pedobacter hartonius]SEA92349.1 Superfamily I DNA and/or RNA helicase [Pedobacter hartonius]
MSADQKAILSFWRAIEVFNLPDLPTEAKPFQSGAQLPWELPRENEKDLKWHHIIFLGKIPKQDITTKIEKAISYIPSEEEKWEERISGDTCLAALIVDEEGRCSSDNGYIQASYIHGLLCLQNNKPLSLIDAELEKVQHAFRDRFGINPAAERLEDLCTTTINWGHLDRELKVLEGAEIKDLDWEQFVFIKSFRLSRHAKPDTAFLNSFYLKDLNELIASQKKHGKGLQQMLTKEISDLKRTDLLTDVNAFWSKLDPKDMPAGRWPSDPNHGLYSAQFGAVATCLSTLRNTDGMLGVNGPPGTGKTTLLSDIVAEVIVMRAQKLLKKGNKKLFGTWQKIERPDFTFHHYEPNADIFSDAGIVVASNNNAAVENISKELPSASKIDRHHFPQANYFVNQSKDLIEGDSWGLLAAALGNAENKQTFKKNFWYPSEERMGFMKFLSFQYNKENDKTVENSDLFDKTANELTELLGQFEKFRKEATTFHVLLGQYLDDLESHPTEQKALKNLTKNKTKLEETEQILNNDLQAISARILSLQQSLALHQKAKPSWFFIQKILKTLAYKRWKETETMYLSSLAENTQKLIGIQQELDSLVQNIKSTVVQIGEKTRLVETIKNRLVKYQNLKKELHERYEIPLENIPDENQVQNYFDDKDALHKASPWSSVKINTLRSNIFLLSLKLHEYAILSHAKPFWNNLNLFMEYLDGKVIVSADVAENLWKTFFFCVPVVSTTLASVSRLFQSMGKESIGWLLIDEAGQATPQSAAGIINRCQKNIIIGDPLQIEPVVSVNSKLVKMLSDIYHTDLLWSPLQNSVQTLADRVSPLGAWLGEQDEGAAWTGFPLRAHRRCNNPMFDIANKIAYNGQMVKVMPDVPFDCKLGASTWFDVKGTTVENKHVISEEMKLLSEKITLLKNTGSEIFVISPFKSVADKCAEIFRGNRLVRCGTIHTFQGKEADIVFLVLGSDPTKPGARAWASKKPNMLNVALTRAKRRFYVIGNVSLWKGCNYFSELAKELYNA